MEFKASIQQKKKKKHIVCAAANTAKTSQNKDLEGQTVEHSPGRACLGRTAEPCGAAEEPGRPRWDGDEKPAMYIADIHSLIPPQTWGSPECVDLGWLPTFGVNLSLALGVILIRLTLISSPTTEHGLARLKADGVCVT